MSDAETATKPSREEAPTRYGLKDSIETFVAEVLDLTVPRSKPRWRERLQARWDSEQALFASKTVQTRRLYSSRFRSAIRDALSGADLTDRRRESLVEEIFAIVRMDREVLAKLNEQYQQRVLSNNTNLVMIDKWREIVDEFTLLLSHSNPRLKALAILALTGRRFAEVLSSGNFEPAYETGKRGRITHKYLLTFKGQLKTREAEGSMFGKSYTIPTLAPAADVLRAFRQMRSSGAGKEWLSVSLEQLNASYNSSLNRILRTRSEIASRWPEEPPLTIKMLRPFYAEVAYEAFSPQMTKATYFAKILGHREDDYNTALSYMVFCLNHRGLRQGVEEVQRVIEERERQIEAVEAARREREDAEADDGEE